MLFMGHKDPEQALWEPHVIFSNLLPHQQEDPGTSEACLQKAAGLGNTKPFRYYQMLKSA